MGILNPAGAAPTLGPEQAASPKAGGHRAPLERLREQLLALDADLRAGRIDAATHERDRARLERAIVAEVLSGGGARRRLRLRLPVGSWPWIGWVTIGAAVALAAATAVLERNEAMRGRPGPQLAALDSTLQAPPAGSAAARPATAGTPAPAPAPAIELSSAHDLAPQAQDRVAEKLVERLTRRLTREPGDADGWAMLARTQAMRGRYADAVTAFTRAAALRRDDPLLLADYADALAMTQGGRLEGEPLRLVQRALAIDPDSLKALSLAGTDAFDRGDAAAAARHWSRLAARGGEDHVLVRQIRPGLERARQLAGAEAAARSPTIAGNRTGRAAQPQP